ncbi:hypothetical protein OIE66_32225 [Nonomuraea sp. NBC_01738]|uniref:hypothetical protein n=1 Tax=Nonomuraea sp. NBC_01738 TaxID=2976003 RepID=UPI002E114E58|nr:hypothetical protein OIE66_32225 [Nonomuraea sp. NBC_01738]
MEDDQHVWPPGSGRRIPPEDDEPWNPRLRRTVERDIEDSPPDWAALPPAARHYGQPVRPRPVRRWRRRVGAVLALVVASGLVAGLAVVAFSVVRPEPPRQVLNDPVAGVVIPLPQGWREALVAPVTGFTAAARSGDGALVMARKVTVPVADPDRVTSEAAELYSRLLLKGDTVTIVEDQAIPGGHTRAMRAEYQDVVNRPAYLRVTLLTRPAGAVLLVGLLQPVENPSKQALDTVMASVR